MTEVTRAELDAAEFHPAAQRNVRAFRRDGPTPLPCRGKNRPAPYRVADEMQRLHSTTLKWILGLIVGLFAGFGGMFLSLASLPGTAHAANSERSTSLPPSPQGSALQSSD